MTFHLKFVSQSRFIVVFKKPFATMLSYLKGRPYNIMGDIVYRIIRIIDVHGKKFALEYGVISMM